MSQCDVTLQQNLAVGRILPDANWQNPSVRNKTLSEHHSHLADATHQTIRIRQMRPTQTSRIWQMRPTQTVASCRSDH